MSKGYVEIEDYWKLRKSIRRAADQNMPKRLGQAHKDTGRFIKSLVDRASDSEAVGDGRGAAVRPSASKREVLLRLGGSFRNTSQSRARSGAELPNARQWGRNFVRSRGAGGRFLPAPDRPDIKGIVEDNRDDVSQFFLRAVSKAMDPAFYKTEP